MIDTRPRTGRPRERDLRRLVGWRREEILGQTPRSIASTRTRERARGATRRCSGRGPEPHPGDACCARSARVVRAHPVSAGGAGGRRELPHGRGRHPAQAADAALRESGAGRAASRSWTPRCPRRRTSSARCSTPRRSASSRPTRGRAAPRVNAGMCAITGYTAAELLSMSIADVTHPDDRARDAETLARAACGGDARVPHREALRPQGWRDRLGQRARAPAARRPGARHTHDGRHRGRDRAPRRGGDAPAADERAAGGRERHRHHRHGRRRCSG